MTAAPSQHLQSPPAPSHAGALLATVFMCQFLVSMDTSLLNVALPSIADGLGFTASGLQWVVTSYLLTFAGFMLLGGRLGDLYGRRRTILTGLTVFVAASLLGALAWAQGALISARALQGLAGAAVAPASLAIVNAGIPAGPLRTKALSLWGAAGAVGGAVGVVLSGLLADALGWRAVLAVNIPIGLIALWTAYRGVPESRNLREDAHLDVTGAVLVTGGVAALVWAVSTAGNDGWSTPSVQIVGAVGLVILAVFLLVERAVSDPLMPLGIFRHRSVVGANLFGFFLSAGQLAAFYFVSLSMQQVWGKSPTTAGLLFLPFCAFIGLGIALANRLVTAVGTRLTLTVLGLVGAVGLGWFAVMPSHTAVWQGIIGPSLFGAVGIGGGLVIMGRAATAGLPTSQAGLASGIVNSSRQLGGTVGLAVLVSLSVSVTAHSSATGTAALADGYHAGLAVGAAFLVVGGLLALVVMPRNPEKTR
jgi:EmrB/QacA subfamily drug resistance transporter